MQVTAKDNFRTNLRTVIEDRRISQRRLAESADVSLTYVSEILTGRSCPTVDIAERLAQAVELDLQDLFEEPRAFARKMFQPVGA
jgi:transcriptional regulator with XRE-family HTH domain